MSSIRIGQISLLVLLCASFGGAMAVESTTSEHEKSTIVGTGAHFSWVIFNDLRHALEHRSGRKIKLFGKESMLGMGCNAGIKIAQQHRPGHETFGFVCCSLNAQELKDKSIKIYPLAKEPILILVNKKSRITNLSRQQVRGIFSGKIKNWREVGGDNKPIVVVTRLHCKHRPGHWKKILSDQKDFRKDRLNVKSAAEMVKRVSDFPGAIGHTGATWIFDHASKVKSMSIGGIAPTAKNLKAGRYPYHRVLSAVTTQHPSSDVMTIIRHVKTGPEFRNIAKKYGLVPLR